MAYIGQTEKQALAPAVKSLLKEYGLKGTLSVHHHSTLCLTVSAGAIDFIEDYNAMQIEIAAQRNTRPYMSDGHIQVNTYWIDVNHSGVAAEFLKRAVTALKGPDWYDRSDIQTDYFDTKHYVSISIGKWDRPYQFTG